MALTVLQQNNKQTPSQWAIKGTHQLYPEAPIENAMTAKMSIQMMTAARSHISTTTTTEVPTVRQCHQVRQVKVNNGARMFIKVPTYRRRWPRGIESPPTYSSDQRWLSTSSRVPFHRRLNGFQWPYVSFREIKPLTYRIGVTWVKLPPEIPLRSEVKDPDIPLTIITTESGIQRQNTLVLQDT